MMRKKLAFFIAFILIFPSITLANQFSDVSSDHPNATAIHYLYENGVINGYENGTFRPEKPVNRAEALKIILLGSNVLVPDIQTQEIFPDVHSDAWYGKFVAKAKNLNIVKGDSDTGMFRPGDTVNLAEALKILLKTNSTKTVNPSQNPYADVPADAWYAPYFEYAKGAQLIDQNQSENVNPSSAITRGMLAELMYRLSQTNYIEPDGEASYYGEKFHGKTTASGAIFDASAFTAAHRTYPFGTWLKVTNVENGQSVVVEVNDRGPYAGENRIIDLSKAAFESISPLSRGIIRVALEVTDKPVQTGSEEKTQEESENQTTIVTSEHLNGKQIACPEVASLAMIDKNFFGDISLENDIPNRLLLDEVLILNGKVLKGNDVTAFIVDSNDQQIVFSKKATNGNFSVHIRFPATGTFKLGMIPGQSGQSLIKEVQVVDNHCIEEAEDSQLPKITDLNLSIDEGDSLIEWEKGTYDLFKVTLAQGDQFKSYILHNLASWTPVYRDFKDFKTTDTKLYIRGASSNESSVLKAGKIKWSTPETLSFIASRHEEYSINENEVDVKSITTSISEKGDRILARFIPKTSLRSTAALILPNGSVKEAEIKSNGADPKKNVVGIEVYSASSDTLTAEFSADSKGIHFLEVNNDQGLAAINIPIYVDDHYPLLPSPRDNSSNQRPPSGNLSDWRNQMLALVNQDRQDHGLNHLKLDSELSNLAQSRSDDMVANNYFSHWDQQGRDANDLKANYGVQTLVGENLARDINLELAEYGLMRSAIHRSNILSEDWTRVGFGITQTNDNGYLVTQIFSTDPLNLNDLGELRQRVLDKVNEKRATNLILSDIVNTVAQGWSEKMADEEFFSFTDKQGISLVDSARSAGIKSGLGTYIIGNSSFSGALQQLESNTQMTDARWQQVGIGIKQDKLGIINITLIYTD